MIHTEKMTALPNLKVELNKLLVKLVVHLNNCMARLKRYSQRYQQRQQLMRLDDRALKDIGLSRVDAEQEGLKSFWKL